MDLRGTYYSSIKVLETVEMNQQINMKFELCKF